MFWVYYIVSSENYSNQWKFLRNTPLFSTTNRLVSIQCSITRPIYITPRLTVSGIVLQSSIISSCVQNGLVFNLLKHHLKRYNTLWVTSLFLRTIVTRMAFFTRVWFKLLAPLWKNHDLWQLRYYAVHCLYSVCAKRSLCLKCSEACD